MKVLLPRIKLFASALQELLKSRLKIVSLEQFLEKFKISDGMRLRWQIVPGVRSSDAECCVTESSAASNEVTCSSGGA